MNDDDTNKLDVQLANKDQVFFFFIKIIYQNKKN